jgi:excisionase family DNA binding protein
MKTMTRLLYSMAEAWETLGIGRTKLYALVADGSLKTVKIGRRTLIEHEELVRYVDSLSTKPTSDHDQNHGPVVAA